MPYNGSGAYAGPASTWNPAVTNTTLNSTDWIALLADFTTAFSTCMLKDGQQTPTANIKMSGFKLTGLAAATTAGDALRYEQLINASGVSGLTFLNPANIVQALTDAATISWDASLGAIGTVTLAGSRTLAAPTNLKAGGRYVLKVTQDGTGGRLLTWNALFKDKNGGTMQEQPDTTAAAVSVFAFDSDGTNLYSSQSYEAPGVVKDHAGSTVPVGNLECDASAVSRTTYARLFAAVGTTWGAGDGSTTFNLPPSSGRGRIGRGAGTVAETVAAGSVSTGSDNFTVSSNNTKWITGQPVVLTTTGGLPAGLSLATTYYLIRPSSTLIQFATTLANAQNATAIDLTTQGTGSHTVTGTLTTRTLGEQGGEENHAQSITELLAHIHTDSGHTHTSRIRNAPAGSSTTAIEANADPGDSTVTSSSNAAVITSTGGNVAMNNMQPFAVYITIIKT